MQPESSQQVSSSASGVTDSESAGKVAGPRKTVTFSDKDPESFVYPGFFEVSQLVIIREQKAVDSDEESSDDDSEDHGDLYLEIKRTDTSGSNESESEDREDLATFFKFPPEHWLRSRVLSVVNKNYPAPELSTTYPFNKFVAFALKEGVVGSWWCGRCG